MVADYFCVFYLYLSLLLLNYCYQKVLWFNRQGKQLLKNETLKILVQNPREAAEPCFKERSRHINTTY